MTTQKLYLKLSGKRTILCFIWFNRWQIFLLRIEIVASPSISSHLFKKRKKSRIRWHKFTLWKENVFSYLFYNFFRKFLEDVFCFLYTFSLNSHISYVIFSLHLVSMLWRKLLIDTNTFWMNTVRKNNCWYDNFGIKCVNVINV